VALLALSLLLNLLIPSMRATDFPEVIAAVVYLALILGISVMGLLIATHRRRNPIGWIMIVGGFAMASTFVSGGYVVFDFYLPSLARPQEMLPGTPWVAWVGNWVWVPAFVPVLTFLLLLFPDGRLPSPRWRPVAWLAVAAMIWVGFGQAFTPGLIAELHPVIMNPAGLAALEGSPARPGPEAQREGRAEPLFQLRESVPDLALVGQAAV